MIRASLLRRSVIAIVLLAVLQGVKWLLNSYSPDTIDFHTPFLTTIQVFTISWWLIVVVLTLFEKGYSWTARFLPLILIVVFIAVDIWFNYLVQHPANIPGSFQSSFVRYYDRYERNDIVYEPCTIYDSIVGHRIIPGLRFVYGNIEYRNQYAVNSESLRDGENELFGPTTIFLGDTYTMGCGVEQEQTFVERLSTDSGMHALNMGLSTPGTAIKLRRLDFVDTSVLETLVVQYGREDAAANAAYLRGDSSIVTHEEYEQQRRRYMWRKEYFPGKYAVLILREKVYSIFGNPQTDASAGEAADFLQILQRLKPNTSYRIVVTQIDRKDALDADRFLKAVDSLIQQPGFAQLRSRVSTVSLANLLSHKDYYLLDRNLKPSGHEKIANKMRTIINEQVSTQDVER